LNTRIALPHDGCMAAGSRLPCRFGLSLLAYLVPRRE
jgi:hypothetical protein